MLMQTQANPELKQALDTLIQIGKIRPIDMAFADFIYAEELALPQAARDCMCILAAYLSAQSGAQHTCLDIENLGQPFSSVYLFPDLVLLRNIMKQSHTLTEIELITTGTKINTPIVLENNQLYLQRYWQYESQLRLLFVKKRHKM